MNKWSLAACSTTILLLTTTVACQLHPTQEGERGNLEFSYHPADGSTEFDRPLAVGSGLTLHVDPLGERSLDNVIGVETSPDSILDAEVTDDRDAIALMGRSSGQVDLEVTVNGGGETYRDSIALEVGDVDRIAMEHRCTSAADAAYLEGWEASIDLERQTSGGDQLVGSTRSSFDAAESCQLDIVPDQYQEAPYCDSAGLHFPTFDEPGPVELFVTDGVATIDNGFRDLGLHIVDPDLMVFDPPADYAEVDRTRTIQLEPVREVPDSGGFWPICTPMELDVEILTPDICRSRAGSTSFSIDADDDNELELQGQRSGICQLDIYLAERPDLEPWPVDIDVRN